jgi:3-oxoacyl-[acyl-carrier-protein] synthase-3
MDGPEIFNFTSEKIPPFAEELLLANSIEKSEITQFVFHQANAFMLNFMRKKMKIDADKFYINLETGNTVSCTIPIALKDYSQSFSDDSLKKVLIVGFGVGLSWAGGLINLKNKL